MQNRWCHVMCYVMFRMNMRLTIMMARDDAADAALPERRFLVWMKKANDWKFIVVAVNLLDGRNSCFSHFNCRVITKPNQTRRTEKLSFHNPLATE